MPTTAITTNLYISGRGVIRYYSRVVPDLLRAVFLSASRPNNFYIVNVNTFTYVPAHE